jgi:hypothetical protein
LMSPRIGSKLASGRPLLPGFLAIWLIRILNKIRMDLLPMT